MILLVAALVFVMIAAVIVGVWVSHDRRREVTRRLSHDTATPIASTDVLLRSEPTKGWRKWATQLSCYKRFSVLAAQAGRGDDPTDYMLIMATTALIGGAGAWLRIGSPLAALIGIAVGGALPVGYLLYHRHRRWQKFEMLFPDCIDIITRSLRAGHAFGGAMEQVADNSADPVASEFRRMADEIRVGLDISDALTAFEERVPLSDVRIFCTAVRVQRSAGGNLAEVLDRLSDIIRDRFKLLSHARALSAQHKYSAVCVGLSPLAFALMFWVLQPTYFDPLLESPYKNILIGGGVLLEAIGFVTIWRIARIEV